MDIKVVADGLIDAVEQLSEAERVRLRIITDLAPGERDFFTAALDQHPGRLAEVALKLVSEWDQMKSAERVASLLVLREILLWGVPRPGSQPGRGEDLTHPSGELRPLPQETHCSVRLQPGDAG
jgi:hypothetical protein